MCKPLYLENENVTLHPFQAVDLPRYDQLAKEIFCILSDEETLRFIPEKRLSCIASAENWLNVAILNAHSERNLVHFITNKDNGSLMGIVDIIPPQIAKEHYRLTEYPYFIEFYLGSKAKNKSLMSFLLPDIIVALKSQGINAIAAVVNRNNKAASRVLINSGFVCLSAFDEFQDFYKLK